MIKKQSILKFTGNKLKSLVHYVFILNSEYDFNQEQG